MASLPAPTESRIAFSVKNTFIEALSHDEPATDEQPSRTLRSLTAPVTAPVAEPDSASCSEASTPERHHREESGADCGADAPALPVLMGRGRQFLARVHAITVKNTFVDLEQSPSDGQAPLSRCITAPARSKSSSPPSSDERSPAAPEEEPPGTPTHWAAVEDHCSEYLPVSTPTPWATSSLELGAGAPPAPPPAARASALVVSVQRAPALEAASRAAVGEPEGRITAAAQDRSIAVSREGDSCMVRWTVESKRLRGNEKQLVSAPFEVTLREGAPPSVFKMMICGQNGVVETAFQKSGGVGSMCLKCCSEVHEDAHRTTVVRFFVSGGRSSQAPRGPVLHQFHSSSVCTLPKHQSIWDFAASTPGSVTFTVSVELSPASFARSYP